MQSGFNFVGVTCSAMSEVSSRGGKQGRRRSTLNTGCRPRNGGIMSLKALFPTALVMVYDPYQISKACGGVQWGVPSANVAILCHPPGSCVAPNVDHVVACT